MTDLVYTHLSVRLPGREHAYLVNPFGFLFEEITASSLVVVDADGLPRQETSWPINPAGLSFIPPSTAAGPMPHASCIRTRLRAWWWRRRSRTSCRLTRSTWNLYGRVGFHPYEGIAADDNLSERERLVRDLGARNALILQNHGLLTVGATIAQAFYRMYYLEQSCRIQIAAQSTGVPLHTPSEAQILRARKQFEDDPDEGRLIWQALRRKLDREQPDYRD